MPWLSWHAFRHTHATLGEQIGMALSDRQAQMGHGDVRTAVFATVSGILGVVVAAALRLVPPHKLLLVRFEPTGKRSKTLLKVAA